MAQDREQVEHRRQRIVGPRPPGAGEQTVSGPGLNVGASHYDSHEDANMNPKDPPSVPPRDDRENESDITDQNPRSPYFLNNPKHTPKGNPGVDNVEDVTGQP